MSETERESAGDRARERRADGRERERDSRDYFPPLRTEPSRAPALPSLLPTPTVRSLASLHFSVRSSAATAARLLARSGSLFLPPPLSLPRDALSPAVSRPFARTLARRWKHLSLLFLFTVFSCVPRFLYFLEIAIEIFKRTRILSFSLSFKVLSVFRAIVRSSFFLRGWNFL